VSHYSQAKNPNRKYLEEGLFVNRMYHKYIEKYEPEVYQRNKEILRYVLFSEKEYLRISVAFPS